MSALDIKLVTSGADGERVVLQGRREGPLLLMQ